MVQNLVGNRKEERMKITNITSYSISQDKKFQVDEILCIHLLMWICNIKEKEECT